MNGVMEGTRGVAIVFLRAVIGTIKFEPYHNHMIIAVLAASLVVIAGAARVVRRGATST
jgi:hypothetical protein